MEARFHRRIQDDLHQILEGYRAHAVALAYDFYAEFLVGLRRAVDNPRFFHFDASGLRRCNLERFPVHFLYDLRGGMIRVWVLRHDKRRVSFGTSRFKR